MANRKIDSRLSGLNPLAYVGVEPISPTLFFSANRSPTDDDYSNYNIGTIWHSREDNTLWTLVDKDGAVATWQLLGAGLGLEKITPDSGIDVVADVLNNINVVGGTNIETVGTLNTLTINVDPDTIANLYITDSGNATPSSGELNILGGTNIATSGSGNTVTITASTLASSFPTDSGTATPSSGELNIVGGGGILTSGVGNVVTIASTAALSLDTDSGSVTPAAGVIQILGGLNANTSGSGDTATVNIDDPGEGVVQSSGAGVFSASKGNDGEMLIGSTAGSPAWSTLTAGSGISIVNAANSVTISTTSGGATTLSNFKATLSASQSNVTGDGTSYQIPFDQVEFDVGSDFNTGTGKFVAPLKGIYYFTAEIYCSDTTLGRSGASTSILVTSATYPESNFQNIINPSAIAYNSNAYTFLCSTMTRMDVADTAELVVTVNGGPKDVGITDVSGPWIVTWFSGFFLADI